MRGEAWRDGSAGVSVLKRVSSAGLLSALCSITNTSASPRNHHHYLCQPFYQLRKPEAVNWPQGRSSYTNTNPKSNLKYLNCFPREGVIEGWGGKIYPTDFLESPRSMRMLGFARMSSKNLDLKKSMDTIFFSLWPHLPSTVLGWYSVSPVFNGDP